MLAAHTAPPKDAPAEGQRHAATAIGGLVAYIRRFRAGTDWVAWAIRETHLYVYHVISCTLSPGRSGSRVRYTISNQIYPRWSKLHKPCDPAERKSLENMSAKRHVVESITSIRLPKTPLLSLRVPSLLAQHQPAVSTNLPWHIAMTDSITKPSKRQPTLPGPAEPCWATVRPPHRLASVPRLGSCTSPGTDPWHRAGRSLC